MDVEPVFIEKCEFFAQAIGKLELLSGNNTVHKNSDLQFTSNSGFSLENYDTIKMTDIFKRFLIW